MEKRARVNEQIHYTEGGGLYTLVLLLLDHILSEFAADHRTADNIAAASRYWPFNGRGVGQLLACPMASLLAALSAFNVDR